MHDKIILVIDNYDSFTFNLVQLIGDLGFKVLIIRNDINANNILKLTSLTAIIISPGPGAPNSSGLSLTVIKLISRQKQIPILGICLGHQSIGHVYKANIIHAPAAMHGKISLIYHDGRGVFLHLPNPLVGTRYHSLTIDPTHIPKHLKINAWSEEGTIMACQHSIYPKIHGIQFHPESLWTTQGKQILQNFLFNN